MNDNIKKAIQIFNQGGVVIFPTDTAFGIGCKIDNEKAIERLFEIRKRPLNQPTPVLVNGLDMTKKYTRELPQDVIDSLINPYWPGALTIVMSCNIKIVPDLVRGGASGNTIGLRMPDNKDILKIINEVGVPILGPSANFHGEKTPFALEDLNPELVKLVDYVLDGKCKEKKASTVIDISHNPWKILREGALSIKIN